MSNKTKNKDYINPHSSEDIKLAEDYITNGVNGVPTRSGLFNTNINRTSFTYNRPDGAVVQKMKGLI